MDQRKFTQEHVSNIMNQIAVILREAFRAALQNPVHFQVSPIDFRRLSNSSEFIGKPLPNAFELFGVDFMVDAEGIVWLLEVNAFPDFAQTGEELQGLVRGLFEGCVDVAVKDFFEGAQADDEGSSNQMVKVLDVDLGRR